jgi:NADH:ubiquinone oxidoreductase subunit F (NADH-binding)
MAALARYAFEFCALESCGKCTPCRIGSTRGVEVVDRIVGSAQNPPQREQQVQLLRDLGQARGTTTVMVTHDPRILDLADRVVELQDGALVKGE